MCVAEDIPSGGGDPCVPGALLFQLQDRQCLDRAADSLAGVLADVAAQTEESDDLEQWAEAWTTLSGADPFAGCGARIPDKVYIRHALYPWRVSAEFARFNPFVCNALTFFSNPFCRATGLRDVYEVEYDHRSAYDDFDLRLDVAGDGFGGTIVSDSGDTIDWVHVKVPAQTEFTAHVELARTWNVTEDDQRWGLDLFIESGEWANVFSGSDIEFFGSGAERRPVPRYRLIVIGGTEHTRATDVTFGGSYVREL
jgi:hypothetical protein